MAEDFLLIGRYEHQRDLQRGDHSTTWLAHDRKENRDCVVKSLEIAAVKDLKDWRLFEREAQVLKNLDHPRIPDFIEYIDSDRSDDDRIHLVQEFVSGLNLREFVDTGRRFGASEIANLGVALCELLIYLHSRRPPIIHRDIKPSNVLIDEKGVVYLVDFGSVQEKVRTEIERRTVTLVGTFGYMPYEQFTGRVTPASDIYALGGTLLFLLTGLDPDEFEHDHETVILPDNLQQDAGLLHILQRCLQARPENRYQDAGALQEDLESWLVGDYVSHQPAAVDYRKLWSWVLVGMVVLVLFLFWSSKDEQASPSADRGSKQTSSSIESGSSGHKEQIPIAVVSGNSDLRIQLIGTAGEFLQSSQSGLDQDRVRFTVFSHNDRKTLAVKPVSRDTVFDFGAMPRGKYRVQVEVDRDRYSSDSTSDGPQFGEAEFRLSDDKIRSIRLVDEIHLFAPVDSRETVFPDPAVDCDQIRRTPEGEPWLFSWGSIGSGMEYRYEVGVADCIRGTWVGGFSRGSTDVNFLNLELPSNKYGRAYTFSVEAWNDDEIKGRLRGRSQQGTVSYFPFKVQPEGNSVKGRLIYAGNRMDVPANTSFWFRDDKTNKEIRPSVILTDRGDKNDFEVFDLPADHQVGASIGIDANPENPRGYPGDYGSFTTFTPSEQKDVLTVAMLKVIHMTSPADNGVGMKHWGVKCQEMAIQPTSIVVAWEPILEADEYQLFVSHNTCSGGRGRGTIVSETTTSTRLDIGLAPIPVNESYSIRIFGLRDGARIAQMTTHGERGGLGWDYRFRVE